MPMYKLVGRYWDGTRPHPVGAVMEFEEGKAPKGSVLIEEPRPEPVAKPASKKD